MPREDAFAQKYRLNREGPALDISAQSGRGLPERFLELVENAEALFERIARLDEALYSGAPQSQENSISNQLDALQKAAEKGVFDPLAIWSRAR
jgi:regulator of CtrA degradation